VPELTRLSKLKFCDRQRNNTKKLTGYPAAWTKTSCTDPSFVQTQLDVGFAMYLAPALKYAASVHVQSNLGKAIFYGMFYKQ
jgi:Glycosyl hydrolase family 46